MFHRGLDVRQTRIQLNMFSFHLLPPTSTLAPFGRSGPNHQVRRLVLVLLGCFPYPRWLTGGTRPHAEFGSFRPTRNGMNMVVHGCPHPNNCRVRRPSLPCCFEGLVLDRAQLALRDPGRGRDRASRHAGGHPALVVLKLQLESTDFR